METIQKILDDLKENLKYMDKKQLDYTKEKMDEIIKTIEKIEERLNKKE